MFLEVVTKPITKALTENKPKHHASIGKKFIGGPMFLSLVIAEKKVEVKSPFQFLFISNTMKKIERILKDCESYRWRFFFLQLNDVLKHSFASLLRIRDQNFSNKLPIICIRS